jgi:acyl-CoA thioesterase-1
MLPGQSRPSPALDRARGIESLTRLVAAVLVALAAAIGPAAARPVTIVALGDSNFNGDGVVRAYALPAQLEELLLQKGYDVRIFNAGVSGDTTAGGLARLDRAVPADADAAIVFLGRNDMRFRVPVGVTRDNITRIVQHLRKRRIPTLLIGFPPYDFSDIARENNAIYYPDFFAGVTNDNGRKRFRYVLPFDPVRHLNPSGYRVIAERLLPDVEKLIGDVGRR